MDELILDIKDGMKNGNYFPHVMMEGMQNIEKVISRMDGEKNMSSLRDNMDTYI